MKSINGSDFVFYYVQLLYCKRQKINPNCVESLKDKNNWMKNKKATINHINQKYSKCFQYAVTVALGNQKRSTKNNKN